MGVVTSGGGAKGRGGEGGGGEREKLGGRETRLLLKRPITEKRFGCLGSGVGNGSALHLTRRN